MLQESQTFISSMESIEEALVKETDLKRLTDMAENPNSAEMISRSRESEAKRS